MWSWCLISALIFIWTVNQRACTYRCLWNIYSFCASLCPAIQQKKLLPTPWLGALKTPLPKCLLLRNGYFADASVAAAVWMQVLRVEALESGPTQTLHDSCLHDLEICLRVSSPHGWRSTDTKTTNTSNDNTNTNTRTNTDNNKTTTNNKNTKPRAGRWGTSTRKARASGPRSISISIVVVKRGHQSGEGFHVNSSWTWVSRS